MPLVDPDDNSEAIAELAESLAERVVAQGAAGAFVATDLTLTVALVGALQRRGVPCYATTSKREVVVTVDESGASVRSSVFRFVQWRLYPRGA